MLADLPLLHPVLAGWSVADEKQLRFDPACVPAGPADPDLIPSFFVEIAGQTVICFDSLAKVAVDREAKTITIFDRAEETTDADISHFLLDHVAPRIIAGSGLLVLHGASVAFDDRLGVFVGETGVGKSTLAASLDRRGHQLLGDDAVVLTEIGPTFYGSAVYPSLRLYPETVEQVFGSGVSTSLMAHYSDKLHVSNFFSPKSDAAHLAVGCVLHLVTNDAKPTIEPLSPQESVMMLIEQSFALNPSDIDAAAGRMAKAAQVARLVPAYRLSYPHDFSVLPEIMRTVEKLFEASDWPSQDAAFPTGEAP